MDTNENVEEAIDTLQELGLKEYEARCFVGLSRLSSGTAKELSEMTEVPRTRIYDAIRVLEAQGLVVIQHSSPQQFRAVSIAEATETLRNKYDDRVDRLESALDTIGVVETQQTDTVQEVWSMAGQEGIENRAANLIAGAQQEVVLVVGEETLWTESLVATLTDVGGEIDLLVGAPTQDLRKKIADTVPNATTFVSGLEWLHGDDTDDETAIGRLLLVDRSSILVSSILPDSKEEQAVFGEGFGNGLVVIARRLMSQGLIPGDDPIGGAEH